VEIFANQNERLRAENIQEKVSMVCKRLGPLD